MAYQTFVEWKENPVQGAIPKKPLTVEQIREQLAIAHKALSEAKALAEEIEADEMQLNESIADAFHYVDVSIDRSYEMKEQE